MKNKKIIIGIILLLVGTSLFKNIVNNSESGLTQESYTSSEKADRAIEESIGQFKSMLPINLTEELTMVDAYINEKSFVYCIKVHGELAVDKSDMKRMLFEDLKYRSGEGKLFRAIIESKRNCVYKFIAENDEEIYSISFDENEMKEIIGL